MEANGRQAPVAPPFKVLVTGGAGMIGSNLCRRLYKPIVVDNLSRGKLGWIKDTTATFVFADLCQPNDSFYRSMSACDYVVHLADVVGGIKFVFGNQCEVFRNNILINSNVIAACRYYSKNLLYVGTACSFPMQLQNGSVRKPLSESDQYPANPESAYGWSKLMGEYEVLLSEKESGINVSVLSLHNVYGFPCDFSDHSGQVIPSIIRKAIRYPEEEFVIWGDGSQCRAFVYVDDVVDAIVSAIVHGANNGVIQIGPDKCTSIRTIAETAIELSGKRIVASYDTSKPTGDVWRCANYSKAKRLLDWEPKTSIKDGMRATYDWIQKEIVSGAS